MSDTEPIQFRKSAAAVSVGHVQAAGAGVTGGVGAGPVVAFDRRELNLILELYGRKVAGGEWRDYALDFGREAATFAVFRRTSEVPLYEIRKTPRLARKQGAYSVVAASGLILKRGPELKRVLEVLEKSARLVHG